ncbi:MAG: peptidoglycan DD-metalloendopeptidase family protein [Gammaproteobacteria bacterium]|nr:peptidoglycan DD-metalloendopeptidase family protein [Gammaproteobacteria bacterium]
MDIILFGKCYKKPLCLQLNQPSCYISILAFFLVFASAIFASGYWFAQTPGVGNLDPKIVQQWKKTVEGQQLALLEAKQDAQAHLDALSQRLGQLQAHIYRVNALGRRLTKMAKLDKGEFNFDQTPAVGGPVSDLELSARKLPDVVTAMDKLNVQLQDRENQLSVLESMLLHGDLQKNALLTGRPIKKGWMSSFYGIRNDPFTGKRDFHKGIDFAGKNGSDIISVAAGVVTWSGDRYGYGTMVEIDHGSGYSTKYAHNSENLVKLGDKITKGQVIAKMGSSGRSTGPHVHFEVVRNNRVVDPLKHLRAAK